MQIDKLEDLVIKDREKIISNIHESSKLFNRAYSRMGGILSKLDNFTRIPGD